MVNSLNPDHKLFDRPIPENMHVDPTGLVDSWIASAEDWLLAFEDTEQVSPQEAFEGIEHWGRLMRCRSQLIDHAQGQEVLQQLQAILLSPADRNAFLAALTFPDLEAWRAQAQAAWDAEEEDLPLARRLIEDLDAADFVLWYCERTSSPEDSPSAEMTEFEHKLNQCHLWLDRHAMLFVIGEPYIRAAALTIPEETQSDDPTGRLLLSAVKYIRLLDECERAWKWMEPTEDIEFLVKQLPLGTLKLDYHVPELSHAAGAQATFVAPSEPLKWYDPQRQTQALLFLPAYAMPGRATQVEILFGTGDDFAQPAESLVGATVRLGAAQSSIVTETSDDVRTVYASLSLAQITSLSGETISLWVDELEWKP